MQITPTGAAGAASATSSATSANATSNGAMAAANDFQTFLTLLTAQMRNQDPLKPVESTEFVSQLASFSAVEQQVRANDRLEQIFAALSSGSNAGLAQWIGREVRAPAAANFQGVPVEIEVDPVEGAQSATLVVRNAFDQVVARRTVDPKASSLSWDGQDALGQTQPNGSYRFEVEAYAGDSLLATEKGRVFSEVGEVRLVNGVPSLLLAGGEMIGVDEVTAVR
jgi:flagellar basal-body rod modification protein FlgD